MDRRRILCIAGFCMLLVPPVVLSAWQNAGSGTSSQGAKGGGRAAAASARKAPPSAARKPVGFDVAPETNVADPYPTFNGIAVDPDNNIVVMSDLNRFSYLMYDRTANSENGEVTHPLHHVFGPKTGMGFVAGIQVDPSNTVILS